MKTIDTAVPDIYKMLSDKVAAGGVDVEAEIEAFGEAMKEIMRGALEPEQNRTGRLRLSAIGQPDRKIYNQFNGISRQDIEGATYLKFLFGHTVEAILVSLLRLSGHEVTGQQEEVEVEGVKGHIDCMIDGHLVDIKSASPHGFKKFKKSTLHLDDPFGYIGQLKAYAHAKGETKFSWLAMDKVSGELSLLTYDTENPNAHYAKALEWSVVDRVNHLKSMVSVAQIPAVCYEPVSEGSSGNFILASGCVYCEYKNTCWPEVRQFAYQGGHKFFTTVAREPRVTEVPYGF
jgi:hypothetical protein